MQTPLINSLLLGLISLTAFTVIFYWHGATRGTWKQWPAGRSLMGLLGIIAVGFAYGVINALIGPDGYPGKGIISFGLYLIFVGAIIFIGTTIRKEILRGRAKEHHPSHPQTGTIDITVATDKEASND